MASKNLYITYKKDTSRLLYWIINTSNDIVRSAASAEECAPVTVNTTGQSTVAEIINMSELIAKHIRPAPDAVFKLFQAVIKARSIIHDAFQQAVSQKPDPEIERSNATHKHFINALTQAFDAFGGNLWTSKNDSSKLEQGSEEEIDSFFSNYFSALSLNGEKADGESYASSEDESRSAVGKTQKKKAKGKKKKGKRGGKPKPKPVPETTPDVSADVPIESYRIIEDKDGLVSEYLLAVYAVTQEWSALRSNVQDLWREVAYDGLNSAVAATLSNIAVAMVKQTCMAVFRDFPGHESYDTIIKTLTRGDPDKANGQFKIGLYSVPECGHGPHKVKDSVIDIKEQFWVNTYNSLVDFITDFRKNRSGKPTKAMQAQLDNWDPMFDLSRATNDERLRWRRSYTINWLYDLVNVFSSIVVQRNTMKGEKHVYENVDWSTTGPWHVHRRLFGLNEFAGDITSLAMQKQHVDVRQKILPHHVFQLQCIVDSLTASRGWMLSPLRGHVITKPARPFYPRRDVDLFLDREVQRDTRGFLNSVDILKQLLARDAELHRDPNRHHDISMIFDDLKYEFINWLGESKYMSGLTTIPHSRFSKSNANGLWEFSPLLCGAGLVEGLVLAQRASMILWDRIPEPTLALHLHNMLIKKGYLKKPVGLYTTLEGLLEESIFPEGIPDSHLFSALIKRVTLRNDRENARLRRQVARDPTKDIHSLLDVGLNHFFNTKTALMMYYDANWLPDRIPDRDIHIPSVLEMLRLSETKRVTDPATGLKRLQGTELVKRAKARGQDDAALLDLASIPSRTGDGMDANALMANVQALKGYKTGPKMDPYDVKQKLTKDWQGSSLLDLLRFDIFADVCGMQPLSSFNYVWITCHMLMLFMELEDRFRAARHPAYVYAYENPPHNLRLQKRLVLVLQIMKAEDEEALKICADVFEKFRMGAMGCIFWEDLRETEDGMKATRDGDEVPMDQCSVM